MKRLLLALLLVLVPLAETSRGSDAEQASEAVVLLHGLGRSDRSMRPLEQYLGKAGYQVYNLPYDSTEKSPEALVNELGTRVDVCCTKAPALHFVGHSLGGILVRAYLAENKPPNVGRVVMLAPPNRGSEIIDKFGESSLFEWAMGPSALQLGTDAESLPNRLPAPNVELGVIAATGSVNPIGSIVIPNEDDGMVSLESTKVDGMTDFLVVSNSHAFIMRSDEVGRQVVHFLQHGRFQHDDSD
jgi:pimeloyl-ACP methyl ester carboxylesterase